MVVHCKHINFSHCPDIKLFQTSWLSKRILFVWCTFTSLYWSYHWQSITRDFSKLFWFEHARRVNSVMPNIHMQILHTDLSTCQKIKTFSLCWPFFTFSLPFLLMVKECCKEKIDVGHFIFFPPSEVGESYCIIANFTSQNQQSFPFT